MAGAVRILKKDNVPPEKDSYIDIDGGFAFAARLDSFENALLGITGRLNEVAAEQSRAAEQFNHTTCQSLEHNSVVLHDLSARVVAAENAIDAMTTSNIGPSVESMRSLGEILDTKLAANMLEIAAAFDQKLHSMESQIAAVAPQLTNLDKLVEAVGARLSKAASEWN
jgi:hypothetical protein